RPPAAPVTSALSLHDALPIYRAEVVLARHLDRAAARRQPQRDRVEEVDVRTRRRVQDADLAGPVPEPDGHHVRRREPAILDLARSEEHTSELQSRENLVCRLL